MKPALLMAALSGLALCLSTGRWDARARTLLTCLLAAMALALVSGCASTPPPAPVAVQAISLAPIEGEIRKAVRSNDTAGAEIERARVALARARKLVAAQAQPK